MVQCMAVLPSVFLFFFFFFLLLFTLLESFAAGLRPLSRAARLPPAAVEALSGKGMVELGPIHRLPRRSDLLHDEEYESALSLVVSAYPSSNILMQSLAKARDWRRCLDVLQVLVSRHGLHLGEQGVDVTILKILLVAVAHVKPSKLPSISGEFLSRLKTLGVDGFVMRAVALQFILCWGRHSTHNEDGATIDIRTLLDDYGQLMDGWPLGMRRLSSTVLDGQEMFTSREFYANVHKVCRELLPHRSRCSRSVVAMLSLLQALIEDTAGALSVVSLDQAMNNVDVDGHDLPLKLVMQHSQQHAQWNLYLDQTQQFAQSLRVNQEDEKAIKKALLTGTQTNSAYNEGCKVLLDLLLGDALWSHVTARAIDSLRRRDSAPSNLVEWMADGTEDHPVIYILGDGDFSFSRSLIAEWKRFHEGRELSLVSSTLLSREEVLKTYKTAECNIKFIEMKRREIFSRIMYNQDATAMRGNDLKGVDYVVFNFPYADFDVNNDSSSNGSFDTHFVAIGRHQVLLRGLFDAFSTSLRTTNVKMKLVITVLLSQAREWGVESLAASYGLSLLEVMAFSLEKHQRHGYEQRRTKVGATFTQSRSGSSRHQLDAWTFIIGKQPM